MVPAARLTAILTGPTASGKSHVAHAFALQHGGIEIINGDSVCVYRGMDIGSAKPTRHELESVPHHLIDIRDPDQPFTAGDFVRGVDAALEEIHARGKRALIVGGTGFYLKALTHGMWGDTTLAPNSELRARVETHSNIALYEEILQRDPAAALRIGPQDRYRLVRAMEIMTTTGKTLTELSKEKMELRNDLKLFLIDRPPADLTLRIQERTKKMLDADFIEEVRNLRKKYPESAALKSVGYAEVIAYLDGEMPAGRKIEMGEAGLKTEIELATRQLAKRQRTFFRGKAFRQGLQVKDYLLDRDHETLIADLKAFYE